MGSCLEINGIVSWVALKYKNLSSVLLTKRCHPGHKWVRVLGYAHMPANNQCVLTKCCHPGHKKVREKGKNRSGVKI